MLGNVTNFLIGQQRERAYQSLSVRSVRAQPPLILAPRDTRVLPGAVSFEWAGSDRLKYQRAAAAVRRGRWCGSRPT